MAVCCLSSKWGVTKLVTGQVFRFLPFFLTLFSSKKKKIWYTNQDREQKNLKQTTQQLVQYSQIQIPVFSFSHAAYNTHFIWQVYYWSKRQIPRICMGMYPSNNRFRYLNFPQGSTITYKYDTTYSGCLLTLNNASLEQLCNRAVIWCMWLLPVSPTVPQALQDAKATFRPKKYSPVRAWTFVKWG